MSLRLLFSISIVTPSSVFGEGEHAPKHIPKTILINFFIFIGSLVAFILLFFRPYKISNEYNIHSGSSTKQNPLCRASWMMSVVILLSAFNNSIGFPSQSMMQISIWFSSSFASLLYNADLIHFTFYDNRIVIFFHHLHL